MLQKTDILTAEQKRSFLSGKPTEAATLQRGAAFFGLGVQQSPIDNLLPNKKQGRSVDCSWTQIVCGGSLLSAVLGLSDKHAPSLTSAWHFCPLHGKLDSILGNVSLHHKQKMLGLALERRCRSLMSKRLSVLSIKAELSQPSGLQLSVGRTAQLAGVQCKAEMETNAVHRSWLCLGLKSGKVSQQKEQSHEESQGGEQYGSSIGNQITRGMHPGAARHFHASLMASKQRSADMLKGRSASARPDPVLEKCDQASEESAPWWRAKLGQVAVRQESGHKRHRTRQRGGRRDKRHRRLNETALYTAEGDEEEVMPSRLSAKLLNHADKPDASQETAQARQRRDGADGKLWLPISAESQLRWKLVVEKGLPMGLTACARVATVGDCPSLHAEPLWSWRSGKQHRDRQCQLNVFKPLGRGVVLSGQLQAGGSKTTQSSLRLLSNPKRGAKWQCTAGFNPKKGLLLTGKYGQQISSPALLGFNLQHERAAGKCSVSLAPLWHQSRIQFAAFVPF